MTDTPVSVLLVDDHAVVREGYRRLIERHPPLTIAAEAGSGEEAYRRYVELAPDVVVMDITLPGASGTQLHRRSRTGHVRRMAISPQHEERRRLGRSLPANRRHRTNRRRSSSTLPFWTSAR